MGRHGFEIDLAELAGGDALLQDGPGRLHERPAAATELVPPAAHHRRLVVGQHAQGGNLTAQRAQQRLEQPLQRSGRLVAVLQNGGDLRIQPIQPGFEDLQEELFLRGKIAVKRRFSDLRPGCDIAHLHGIVGICPEQLGSCGEDLLASFLAPVTAGGAQS